MKYNKHVKTDWWEHTALMAHQRAHHETSWHKMVPNENTNISLISPPITVIFSALTSCKVSSERPIVVVCSRAKSIWSYLLLLVESFVLPSWHYTPSHCSMTHRKPLSEDLCHTIINLCCNCVSLDEIVTKSACKCRRLQSATHPVSTPEMHSRHSTSYHWPLRKEMKD